MTVASDVLCNFQNPHGGACDLTAAGAQDICMWVMTELLPETKEMSNYQLFVYTGLQNAYKIWLFYKCIQGHVHNFNDQPDHSVSLIHMDFR